MMKYLQRIGKSLMLPVAVLPAAGVIRPSKNTVQVVIGPKVQFVYDELKKITNI